jgi:cysteinyl-tRNA synthetase
MTAEEIDAIVAEREEARRQRDFARADEIKARLTSVRWGMYRIALLDEPSGTYWYWTAKDA